jgi:predicted nuclease of predicted toxin-antitoxin system
MTTAIQFHLDEHVDHDIARGLRLRGIDVTTATDAGLRSADDDAHLAFALVNRRVLFTNDADFLSLHHAGAVHAGIVYCPVGSRSVGEIVRFLALMHTCLEADDMMGRVEYC